MEIIYRQSTPDDTVGIKNLLQQNNLPFEDISEGKVKFIVALNGKNITGCIGLESVDGDGLLRSFVVDENFRNKNIGNELLNKLVSYSFDHGVKTLHLLTTTAARYFERKGFSTSKRDDAPQGIRLTTEFTELCPASSIYMTMPIVKKKILVLCTGNSCRSQIAEGYLRYYAGCKAEVFSAGVETHGVNPKAVETMKEDGIDISTHTSNNINEYRNIAFDFVITVCDNAKERCPYFPSNAKKFHHNFPDPAKATGTNEEIMQQFRLVRQQIKDYCRQFVEENLQPT
ncbi:MAG: GNAT family N-acetyltransferase [Bacteroidetes bacterium]|nr:GNAT family N-acetyltransferase [Bacteroidota bacterium]